MMQNGDEKIRKKGNSRWRNKKETHIFHGLPGLYCYFLLLLFIVFVFENRRTFIEKREKEANRKKTKQIRNKYIFFKKLIIPTGVNKYSDEQNMNTI